MSKILQKTSLFLTLFFTIFIGTFSNSFLHFCYAINNKNLVEYKGQIYHLFTHCLIADTEIAFSKNNTMREHYDRDCLTVLEFKNILSQLYKNDYILIKPSSIFYNNGDYGVKKTLHIPPGKKPLILSFDDVNYDQKKSGKGMVDKIAITTQGDLVTYTNGNPLPQTNNEFITILENFVKSNPDFSFDGAKGLICLTGYDGILGYRTNKESPNREQEIKQAKVVVNKLKQLGWEFASHSYGHYHMKKISNEKFKSDINSWKNEVENIVGKTQIYVYPYGEREVIDSQGNISDKHLALEEAGFRLFCGVGINPYFSYLPNNLNKKILFMDRTPLDGYTLQNNYQKLSHLFDIKKIYDNRRDKKLTDFLT